MKANLIVLTILLAAAALYTWRSDRKNITVPPLPMAADFTMTDEKGRDIRLSDYKGRAIILNFWATWCAPCVIEFPQMIAAAKNRDDITFILVSIDDDRAAYDRFLKKHAKNHSGNVIFFRDPSKKIATLYGTKQLPETYLITKDFRIAEKLIGLEIPWDGSDIKRRLGRL